MTWLEIMNLIFKAHREGDILTKHMLISELDSIEPDYADTLDIFDYAY